MPGRFANRHTHTHVRANARGARVFPALIPWSSTGVLTPSAACGPSAGFANTLRAMTRALIPRRRGSAVTSLSRGIAVVCARSRAAAPHLRRTVEKIYSAYARNPTVGGIAFWLSATHSRQATGTDAELVKEDEIPQQRVIATSPTRQEVIAADAHHSGRPLAARERPTAVADDGRHQN